MALVPSTPTLRLELYEYTVFDLRTKRLCSDSLMNAPLHREVLLRRPDPESELPLATEGVQRYVWDSRFGSMLIEVIGDDIYVNGGKVERQPVSSAETPRVLPRAAHG